MIRHPPLRLRFSLSLNRKVIIDVNQTLMHKLYGGFLGMNVGIRLGAPVEPRIWTVERIKRTYGDIRGYIKEYKHFAADDDTNGPVFFLRALDDTQGREPTPQSVAEAYLNYAREGIGMFWWGGLGVSTEHTAYLNLLAGIPAPQSGSIRQNGSTVAEQIGGQIFIDTWGLVAAGDPARAARYARAAASVSHDGEALHGAAFIAACIAEAFNQSDIEKIMDTALETIPSDSKYYAVVQAARAYRREHPEDDWQGCRQMLEEEWGYDRYPGVCHVIPNAGVCALALTYGAGDFSRTVEIATMCGWDTDCNAGNVGTIVGVLNGIEGIPAHYRDPINDELVLSSVSGYLNIMDVPTYIWQLAMWVYRLKGESVPEEVQRHIHPGEIDFDFALPGSTHGLCVSDPCLFRRRHEEGALEIMWNRMARGQQATVYLKTFYRRDDFSDERYKPVFSPLAYPGQQARIDTTFEKWNGESICVTPYVREGIAGKMILLSSRVLREPGDYAFDFTLPDVDSGVISEVGLHIEGNSPRITYDAGRLLIRGFRIFGKAEYTVKVGIMPEEFLSILPFSQNHGAWNVEGGRIHVMALNHAEAMTGNYFMRDVSVTGRVCPRNGTSHLVSARVQGTRRGYYAGFDGENKAAILKHEAGRVERLATVDCPWRFDEDYELTFTARGDELTLAVGGRQLLTAKDDAFGWGMAGYAMYGSGRAELNDITVKEL